MLGMQGARNTQGSSSGAAPLSPVSAGAFGDQGCVLRKLANFQVSFIRITSLWILYYCLSFALLISILQNSLMDLMNGFDCCENNSPSPFSGLLRGKTVLRKDRIRLYCSFSPQRNNHLFKLCKLVLFRRSYGVHSLCILKTELPSCLVNAFMVTALRVRA